MIAMVMNGRCGAVCRSAASLLRTLLGVDAGLLQSLSKRVDRS
jgi:hypothetical protein